MLTVHANPSSRHFTVDVNARLVLSYFFIVNTLVRVSVALTRCNDNRYYNNYYIYYNYYFYNVIISKIVVSARNACIVTKRYIV